MEKTIANKMTFYDLVTLIVPSALVCYIWRGNLPKLFADSVAACPCGCTSIQNNWLKYIVAFGVLLFIGLIMKLLASWWNGLWFRNNTDMLKPIELKHNKGIERADSCAWMRTWFCEPIQYCFSPLMKWFGIYQEDVSTTNNYYKTYENAFEHPYYNQRIGILESHIAFLQVWLLAIVLILPHQSMHKCCMVGIGILSIYIGIRMMISLQKKIYNMVFESEKYPYKGLNIQQLSK